MNSKKKKKRTKPKDFINALDFFFGMSFFQGRNYNLSKRYYLLAMNYLRSNDFSSVQPIHKFKNSKDKKEKIKIIYKSFLGELESAGLVKEADRIMVLDTIGIANQIKSQYQQNIIEYLICEIKKGDILKASDFLKEIYSIGAKITGLVLRDIVHLYKLDKYINQIDEYSLLQPIDTWVHQDKKKIGIINNDEISKTEATEITKFCLQNDINPFHYNEGAWYLGSQSLTFAIKRLTDNED